MFRAHRPHHQERQIVSIQPPVAVSLCRWPCRVQVGSSLPTCTRHGHRQIPEVVLTQCVPPDDEHDVLERCRELKIKINTYKRIVRHAGHLPRIIKWCTVNKIYKKEICLQISLLCVMTPLIFLQCPGNSYRLVLSQTSSEFLKAL